MGKTRIPTSSADKETISLREYTSTTPGDTVSVSTGYSAFLYPTIDSGTYPTVHPTYGPGTSLPLTYPGPSTLPISTPIPTPGNVHELEMLETQKRIAEALEKIVERFC